MRVGKQFRRDGVLYEFLGFVDGKQMQVMHVATRQTLTIPNREEYLAEKRRRLRAQRLMEPTPAMEAERRRKEAEPERRRKEAEAKLLRKQMEAERRRKQMEAERRRKQMEAERRRKQMEAERRRKEAEAELLRKEAEAVAEMLLRQAEAARRQPEDAILRQQLCDELLQKLRTRPQSKRRHTKISQQELYRIAGEAIDVMFRNPALRYLVLERAKTRTPRTNAEG